MASSLYHIVEWRIKKTYHECSREWRLSLIFRFTDTEGNSQIILAPSHSAADSLRDLMTVAQPARGRAGLRMQVCYNFFPCLICMVCIGISLYQGQKFTHKISCYDIHKNKVSFIFWDRSQLAPEPLHIHCCCEDKMGRSCEWDTTEYLIT